MKGSGAMSDLSLKWNALSPEEKLAYAPENFVDDEDTHPNGSGLRANSESLKLAEKRVDNWMDEWQKKVIPIYCIFETID